MYFFVLFLRDSVVRLGYITRLSCISVIFHVSISNIVRAIGIIFGPALQTSGPIALKPSHAL